MKPASRLLPLFVLASLAAFSAPGLAATEIVEKNEPILETIRYTGVIGQDTSGLYLANEGSLQRYDSIRCGDSAFFGKSAMRVVHGKDEGILTYSHYEPIALESETGCEKIANMARTATASCPLTITYDFTSLTVRSVKDCAAAQN
jgi:hypothetical protein